MLVRGYTQRMKQVRRKAGLLFVLMLLNPKTWILWVQAIHRERRTVTLWHLLKSFAKINVPPKIWAMRLEKCEGCPIYDTGFKTCRLSKESAQFLGLGDGEEDLGCGCFMPFRALVPEACWAWERTEGELGWPQANLESP